MPIANYQARDYQTPRWGGGFGPNGAPALAPKTEPYLASSVLVLSAPQRECHTTPKQHSATYVGTNTAQPATFG